MSADSDPAQGLAGRVQRGVGWTMASQVAIQGLALMTSVVIARFMSPHDVGLATEAIVFVTLALVLVDLGFASVVVQRPDLTEADLSTLFWAGTAFGIVMTLIGLALSGPIAELYGQPRVQGLFAVLSVTFAIVAPGIVQGGLLIRDLQFRSLELRTIASTVASCTVAIVLAVLGAGPWAIVAQTITVGSVSTALLWRSSSWRPRWLFSTESLRGFFGFASHLLGAQMLRWANANLDNFLVGRVLGAAPLGAYSLAFGIALTPVSRIAVPVAQVFFPAFSRIRDRERIAEVWLRAVRLQAFAIVPSMLGLVVVAPDLVAAVFGAKWRSAAPVMQVLAGVALVQSLTAMNDGVLQALDNTRLLLRFTLVLSALTVVGFAAGLPWGITGVAWGYLIVALILHPVYVWLTGRGVGVSPIDWARCLTGTFQAAGVMLLADLVARRLLIHAGVPAGVRLVALTLLGIAVYLPLGLWRVPQVKNELRTLLEHRREARA